MAETQAFRKEEKHMNVITRRIIVAIVIFAIGVAVGYLIRG